jgi:hypothetical protein
MRESKYRFFTANEIKPSGWLRERLLAQARGLCGNLHKVWPDVRESKWIGGNREGWERVPYWLDGFIPMAWLLDDPELKETARGYIDAILKGQDEDGWICPCAKNERAGYDVWAVFLICKVLVLYHDCTGDERIPGAVYQALRCLHSHLEFHTLFGWGAARWYECLIPLRWLYEQKAERWIFDLAVQLKTQGFDYEALFRYWPYEKPQGIGRWNFLTHVVNLAMCLKSEALFSSFLDEPNAGDRGFASRALEILLRDHGMPAGHFTGDECLAGRSPLQGTELCGVVEAMYSCEWLLALSGDDCWAERLESLAFNALPAALSPDMWSHQYDQMTNQVQCARLEKSHFMTNNGEAHLFGLEPHYGCCTANFGQGWPKLALAGLLREGEGIALGAIVPCRLDTVIKGVEVTVEVLTDYPFEDAYRLAVTAAEPVLFPLSLRIPAPARNIKINGEAAGNTRLSFNKTWQGKTEIRVEFDFETELVPHGDGLHFLRRGALVYALPVKARREKREYVRDGVERKFPYCDYELFPETPWNYAFTNSAFIFRRSGAPSFDPALASPRISTRLVPIDWPLENGAAAPRPVSKKAAGPAIEAEFIPYGCTDLRMTALPVETVE